MKFNLSITFLFISSILFAESDWKVVLENDEYTLRCVDFVDHRTALAVGDNGVILKSIDGGKNWKEKSKDSFGDIKLVAIFDKDVAAACGDGFIIRTKDGGETWSTVFAGDKEVFRYLKFMKNDVAEMPGRVIAAGNKGLLLISNSYGEKWYKQPVENISGNLDILYCVSNYFKEIDYTLGQMLCVDGYVYETRNAFKSRWGSRKRYYNGDKFDVVHTYHEFDGKSGEAGTAYGALGAFAYLWSIGTPIDYSNRSRTNNRLWGGFVFDFTVEPVRMRLAVGEGGAITEGTEGEFQITWKARTGITNKDLFWADFGKDPEQRNAIAIVAVGDGVILHREFGKHPNGSDNIEEKEPIEMVLYPNPTVGMASLSYSVKNTETVSYQLLDVNGNIIDHQRFMNQTAGDYKLPIDRLYQSGIYIIRLQVGTSVATRRLVKQ